ncbi:MULTISPECIES: hypothetical protein [Moorena]|uniref:Uncharacterized protein n=1 Tax=Moorena producens 3L TaxID=489825 RepID=F4XJ21_9CYAN|nr:MULTISPECIES: hypothetical protein [Moorena]EGJ35478.1 hypothetical protein LYNGBM3L_04790 [Moorena producens 3L]NEP36183.1 hypothetical protein [Moorena sp. SIO3B2]NEP69633.1 hypothetical protein [Moorena sp. SIO3A5]NET67798.1 hypothetical protein [Moorena sp. SIO1G6]OLT64840.1 hypothetical protein BI334_07170 [Moorena producens 3L]
MAPSDDFRQYLKTGNIKEALVLALSEAVDLKITTWVADTNTDLDAAQAKPGHRMCTRIDTINGAIDNEVGDQFIGNGRYRELRQFHNDQVAQGNQIIQSNLKSLHKLFEVLLTLGYPTSTTGVIEPESPRGETHLLPSIEPVTETRVAIESVESVESQTEHRVDTVTKAVLGTGLAAAAVASASELVAETPPAEVEPTQAAPETPPTISADLESVTTPTPGKLDDSLMNPYTVTEPIIKPGLVDEVVDEVVSDAGLFPEITESNELPETTELEEEEAIANFLQDRWSESESVLVPPPPIEEETDISPDLLPDTAPEVESVLVTPPPIDEETEIIPDFLPDTAPELESILVPPPPVPEETQASPDSFLETEPELLEVPSAELESSLMPSTDSTQALEAETEQDDWDDSMWELLESVPDQELSDQDVSDAEIDQQWQEFVEEQSEPADLKPSDAVDNQNWELLTLEDLESTPLSPEPTTEASNHELEEEWGDLFEEDTQQIDAETNILSLESLELEENEDWDDWMLEQPQESSLELTTPEIDSLDVSEDNEWDTLTKNANPFTAPSNLNGSATDLELDEDWDDFPTDELESYPSLGNSLDLSAPSEDPDTSELTNDLTDDLTDNHKVNQDESQELDPFLEISEITDQSEKASEDLMEDLFDFPVAQQTESEPIKLDDDNWPSLEESLFIKKPRKKED